MLRILLFPFAILYDLITRVRNYLYDTGRRYSIQFEANVIAVGNLTVGGTGKTPHIEYLVRLLKTRYKVATLSRGYGRKTKGFHLADETSSAITLGDEPYQYYRKFGKEVVVAVGEERALAVPSILLEHPEVKVILLDDAYQHRAVRPLLNILLSDYHKPFYKDNLLPAGRLRESRKGASRADVVIVTKCPDTITSSEQGNILTCIREYTAMDTPVFFTGIKYGSPVSVFKKFDWEGRKVVLFTGLADAKPLEAYIRAHYNLVEHFSYSDHHNYSEADLNTILTRFNALNQDWDHILLTTEKDMVKFHEWKLKHKLEEIPFFYIPIEIYFLKEQEKFNTIVYKKGIIF
jgi:tetraacyldisaccharide 4'-kinase